MEKTLLVIGLLTLIGSSSYLWQDTNIDLKSKFAKYQERFNKNYSPLEEQYRYQVYLENLQQIEAFNLKKGKQIFGETQFSDLTDEEFKEIYLTLKITQEDMNVERKSYDHINAEPQEIDWRPLGAVTPVKNQGKCGSCWTFSTTGVLEGFFFTTTGTLPSLSEQQLVDCSTDIDLNYGCNGGLPQRALNFVKRNGLTTEEGYPYQAVQQSQCLVKGGAYKVSGSTVIEISEWGLYNALQQQPVSIGVDASNWKNYAPATKQIFEFEDCGDNLNHAVLAVGFTESATIVKNSWAETWGSNGYIYLERGKNTCGIWNALVIPK